MTEDSTDMADYNALLERCSNKDKTAFKNLYEHTSPKLFATLLRMLRVEAVAEEALQESYIKIWQNAGDYRPEQGQALTWMTSIARYHALDILRKRLNDTKSESASDSTTSEESSNAQIQVASAAKQREMLDSSLGRLRNEERVCITRTYIEGLSPTELSDSINSHEGTVKTWTRQGLISLQAGMNDYT